MRYHIGCFQKQAQTIISCFLSTIHPFAVWDGCRAVRTSRRTAKAKLASAGFVFFAARTETKSAPNRSLPRSARSYAKRKQAACFRLLPVFFDMVEVTGLEPAASASRTQRSTKLSHTSIFQHSGVFPSFFFRFISRLLCYYSTKLRKCQVYFSQFAKIIRKHNLPLEIQKEMWYNVTRTQERHRVRQETSGNSGL